MINFATIVPQMIDFLIKVENRIHYSNGNHVNVTIERLVGVLLSTIPNDQSKSVV